jgi:hypothetical protein
VGPVGEEKCDDPFCGGGFALDGDPDVSGVTVGTDEAVGTGGAACAPVDESWWWLQTWLTPLLRKAAHAAPPLTCSAASSGVPNSRFLLPEEEGFFLNAFFEKAPVYKVPKLPAGTDKEKAKALVGILCLGQQPPGCEQSPNPGIACIVPPDLDFSALSYHAFVSKETGSWKLTKGTAPDCASAPGDKKAAPRIYPTAGCPAQTLPKVLKKGKIILWRTSPEQDDLLDRVYGDDTLKKFGDFEWELLRREALIEKRVFVDYYYPYILKNINDPTPFLAPGDVALTTPLWGDPTNEVGTLIVKSLAAAFKDVYKEALKINASIVNKDRFENKDSKLIQAYCTACRVELPIPDCKDIPPYPIPYRSHSVRSSLTAAGRRSGTGCGSAQRAAGVLWFSGVDPA